MRILHLVGSPTSEFFAELSVLYARGAVDALAAAGHEQEIAHVGPDGSWRFPADLSGAALAGAEPVELSVAVARLRGSRAHVALPHLFCRAGMTAYRALLEVIGVPYLGNRPEVMAVGADKRLARILVAAAGVPVPPAVTVRRGAGVPGVELPVVVKPVDADNSTGVTLVERADDLAAAVELALQDSTEALVERFVPLGREVRCGVLDTADGLMVLPLEEYAVDATHKPIRLAEDKLRRTGDGALGLVAKDAEHAWLVGPDDPVVSAVASAARDAFRALGCRHYGLFDFRVDPDGTAWFLEAGLYCSFSPSSVLAVMATGVGIDAARLFELVAGPAR